MDMKAQKYFFLFYVIILLSVCSLIIYDLIDLPWWIKSNPGPALIPGIITFIILVCFFIDLIKEVRRKKRKEEHIEGQETKLKLNRSDTIVGLLAIVMSSIYIFSLKYLGYVVSTAIFLFLVPFGLSLMKRRNQILHKGIKLILFHLGYTISITFLIWFAFVKLLRVSLP